MLKLSFLSIFFTCLHFSFWSSTLCLAKMCWISLNLSLSNIASILSCSDSLSIRVNEKLCGIFSCSFCCCLQGETISYRTLSIPRFLLKRNCFNLFWIFTSTVGGDYSSFIGPIFSIFSGDASFELGYDF